MKRVYTYNYVGVGTLVSSQERRAAVVTVINLLSTACQLLVLFLYRFPDMACMQRVYRDTKRRWHTGQQPGAKSGHRPGDADKPRVSRWSNAGLVSPPLYIGFPLFVLPGRRFGQLFSML